MRSKTHSKYYVSCTELPLRKFIDVINTSDYSHLLKKPGKVDHRAVEVWGDILLEYGKLDGNNSVSDKFEKTTELRALQNAYTTIKAMLRLLLITTPSHPKHGADCQAVIDDLAKMGYKINLSSTEKYLKSIQDVDRRSNYLLTMIQMKKNELNKNHDEAGVSFDDIMSMLSMNFKSIDENITVSRYCSCKKILKQQSKDVSKRSQKQY